MKTWPGLRDEEGEQLEGLGLERHRLAVAQDAVAGEVHLDAAEIHERRRGLRRGQLLGAAEDRADAGGELAQAERLGHVVVRAELQAHDLVHLAVAGREHDDRDLRLRAEDPADLDAGQLRQHEVEQHQVRLVGAEPDQRLAAVRGGNGPVALELERFDEGLAEGRLVVHDEDRAGHVRAEHAGRQLTTCSRRVHVLFRHRMARPGVPPSAS